MSLTITSTGVEAKEGETIPVRHPLAANGLLLTHDPSVTTIYENFHRSVKLYGDRDFLGARKFDEELGQMGPFEFESYEKVSQRILNVAAALKAKVQEKACIGLYSVNRPEWVIAEQACYANNMITVPIYDTLGDESMVHIFSQTDMEVTFASADKIKNLLNLKDKIATLTTIVSMDEKLDDGLLDLAKSKNVKITLMKDFEAEGEKAAKDFKPTPPKDTDLATICYTSGTTGLPKGAMITHRSLLAAGSAGMALLGFPVNEIVEPLAKLNLGEESYLSYLPLAHIFERVIQILLVSIGAKIGFYQGDVLKLMDDLAALRPTIFVSVPRLYSRIYNKVQEGLKTKGFIAQTLFKYAYASKLAALRSNGNLKHWLWDRIFGAIREKLGGRVKLMITGAAPIAPDVHDFLRIAFSCDVYEGYGMTECCALATISAAHDATPKQVGIPAPCVEIKLVDVPEIGCSYYSNDRPRPRGEIWIRGPSVFSGYYKADDKTAETLTADGWLITGDVAEVDEEGRIYLIDRKKSLLKLAQGEYVAPEKVEAVLGTQPLVAQAFVEGNSLKSYVVAIVVPDQEALGGWARSQGITGKTPKELMEDERLKAFILKEFKGLGSAGTGELKGFEIPKAIHLEAELFSVENNLLTPSFKLKRPIARNKYKAVVEELYKKHGD